MQDDAWFRYRVRMTTIRFLFCCAGWIGNSQAFILSSPNGIGTRQFAAGK
jgi:hypothetical protein